jgi:hypothetical protein
MEWRCNDNVYGVGVGFGELAVKVFGTVEGSFG